MHIASLKFLIVIFLLHSYTKTFNAIKIATVPIKASKTFKTNFNTGLVFLVSNSFIFASFGRR